MTRIVQLKNIKPTEMVPIIQPFAKLANSILPIDANGILVLRDNAENVKRMLQMIERVDVSVPRNMSPRSSRSNTRWPKILPAP